MKYFRGLSWRLYSFSLPSSILFLAPFLCATVFVWPLSVYGHEAGASWEAVEGDYRLDIGYSGGLSQGESTVFDFALFRERGGEEVSFESVWVRLGGPSGVNMAGRLHGSKTDKTILNYKFSEAGEHTLLARFVGEAGVLAEHTFAFNVFSLEEEVGTELPTLSPVVLIYLAAAFLLGAFLTYLYSRRHV